MSNIYSNERVFKLTQGAIITNCITSLGNEVDTWGFILTARCDCENKKVTDVYYLPIINLGDWFQLYEKKRVYDMWITKQREVIVQKLNSITKSEISDYGIFSKHEIEKILQLYSPKEKDRKEILLLYQNLQEDSQEPFIEYLTTDKLSHDIKTDIERLSKNQDNNFLLIPDWQPRRQNHHKVIMLKEIKRLKSNIAFAFEDPSYSITEKPDFNIYENDIKTNPTDIYCIEKLMLSPYVEDVMQRFAYNFARIGIDRLVTATNENLFKEIQESL